MNSSLNSTMFLENVTSVYRAYLLKDIYKEHFEVVQILLGYIMIPLMAIVVIADVTMIVVFYKGNFRSPTYVLLTSLALLDMATGTSALIPSVYFHTFGNSEDYVPYNWCLPYDMLLVFVPKITHCASLYVTVCMALERFIVVNFPFRAKQLCTVKKSLFAVCCVIIFSVAIYSHSFVALHYQRVRVPSFVDPMSTIDSCTRAELASLQALVLSRIIVASWLPIILLIVLKILLILSLRKIRLWRAQFGQNANDVRQLVILTCALVWFVLIAEIPGTIGQIYFTYGSEDCKECKLRYLNAVMNVFVLVLYPSSFLLCCCVSQQFRQYFVNLFNCETKKECQNSRTHYTT